MVLSAPLLVPLAPLVLVRGSVIQVLVRHLPQTVLVHLLALVLIGLPRADLAASEHRLLQQQQVALEVRVQRVVLGPAVPARQVDLVLEGLDLPRLHQVSDQQLVVSAVLVPRLQTPLPVSEVPLPEAWLRVLAVLVAPRS